MQIQLRKFGLNLQNKADRDGRDNSVTIRTNRWYLRIWFWTIERVVHCVYVVACYVAKTGLRDDWIKHASKENGRKRFQVDLGMLMMEFGIRYDWNDVSNPNLKPKWMRQKSFLPCVCGICFFCKEGYTNGMCHKVKSRGRKRKCVTKKSKEMQQCSGKRETFGSSYYCGSCYRKHKQLHPDHCTERTKELIMVKFGVRGGKPQMGCLNCNERVCKGCWPTYDHYPTESKKTK